MDTDKPTIFVTCYRHNILVFEGLFFDNDDLLKKITAALYNTEKVDQITIRSASRRWFGIYLESDFLDFFYAKNASIKIGFHDDQ